MTVLGTCKQHVPKLYVYVHVVHTQLYSMWQHVTLHAHVYMYMYMYMLSILVVTMNSIVDPCTCSPVELDLMTSLHSAVSPTTRTCLPAPETPPMPAT